MKHTTLRSLISSLAAIFCVLSVSASAVDPCASLPEGKTVNVNDMLTKVYGLIPATLDEWTMTGEAAVMGLVPVKEDGGLWLDSAEGYRLSYAGVSPEVSARAEYEDGALTGFTYYFIFPYECDRTREIANKEQCRFCGSMLQEMNDMGVEMAAGESDPEMLIDASGVYGDSQLKVNLLDDDNRFLLILSVTPEAFTAADSLLASAD